jgi:choice-of-anchor B domain-containing protein
MGSMRRTWLCGALCVMAFLGTQVFTTAEETSSVAAELIGFGGAVLAGDGEVFAGEAANQHRPGMVYIYRKGDRGWAEAATLTGPKPAVGDGFGASLALDGTRLFVGAGVTDIHVFVKQGNVWSLSSSIAATAVPMPPAPPPATPPAAGTAAAEATPNVARFGTIAASGDWLLVGKEVPGGGRGRAGGGGARGGGAPAAAPAGAVFAFKRDASGQYAYHSTIVAADAAAGAGDNFGVSIATSLVADQTRGPMALVGASGQANRAGVVHEFALDADGTWKSQRTFAPVGGQANGLFGSRIAINGDVAMIAAPGDAGGYGAVYAFRRVAQAAGRGRAGGGQAGAGAAPATPPSGGNFTWAETTRLAAPASGRGDGFGTSIAADEREVWVGAPGAAASGRVFVFPGNAAGFQIDGMKLLGPGMTDPAAAGASISIRGNLAAVGATGANRRGGGLLIYERDTFGAWREQPMITTALDELPMFSGSERRCSTSSGKVEMFDCAATDLLSFVPPSRMSHDGHYIEMSSLWGWSDPVTKQDWAIMGRRDGATFVDITRPTQPISVADMPLTDGARPSSWREIKVYKDHAFVVSDGSGAHGIQIFDMTRLRSMKPQPNGLPQKVAPDVIYREVNSVHNMVINEESGFGYAVGSSAGGTTCGGGLHMIDIREPKKPAFVGCFADTGSGRAGTGYSHDAICINYKGPDKRYRGREICVGSNETAISLADVTDKKLPKFLARVSHPNTAYTHQGWFDETQRYFYVNDELDEGNNGIDKTRTLIYDLQDLENPRFVKAHMGVEAASDHNLFVKGDLMYQANYRSGLRILSVRDPLNPKEVAYFDTAPFHSNGRGFNGAWNVYPFFKNGTIIVSSIEQGLFVLKTADR